MKTHILTGAILSSILMGGLTGCGSGGGSPDTSAPSTSSAPSVTTPPSTSKTSLRGGYLITYTPAPTSLAASRLQGALGYGLASMTFHGGIRAAGPDPIRFNLRLEDDGSGNYSGSYSDDSGLISDSVSGTSDRLVVDFGDDSRGLFCESVTDPQLRRQGQIILTDASLDASGSLEAEIQMSISDKRSDADVTDSRGRGRGRGNSERTSDDSSSDDSSSDDSSSDDSSSDDSSSDDSSSDDSSSDDSSSDDSSSDDSPTSDAARIPGNWQVVGPASYKYSGEILVLKADKSVGLRKDNAVSTIPGATYVYTPGAAERLIITIADREYDMTDVKKRATAATGKVTYESRSFPVGLRKL